LLILTHKYIPYLGGLRMYVVSQLSLFLAIELHLLLECGMPNNRFDLTTRPVTIRAK